MLHKIMINHETPFCMMKEMQNLTDYDYALVHLFKDNPDYKKYFEDALKAGRKVLLDNSVFELDKPFDPDAFVEAINDLGPTWYVVPDFLDDSKRTIESMAQWIRTYLPKVKTNSKIIGSIQGATWEEMLECYKFMSRVPEVSKIAITFNSLAYSDMCPDILGDEEPSFAPTQRNLQIWLEGRPRFISKLVAEGYWNKDKPHHLLGCGLMREFANPIYHRISVESLDTSNPVIYGLNEKLYDPNLGNTEKPSMKLCDHLNDELTDAQKDCIRTNVGIFKTIANGFSEDAI